MHNTSFNLSSPDTRFTLLYYFVDHPGTQSVPPLPSLVIPRHKDGASRTGSSKGGEKTSHLPSPAAPPFLRQTQDRLSRKELCIVPSREGCLEEAGCVMHIVFPWE